MNIAETVTVAYVSGEGDLARSYRNLEMQPCHMELDLSTGTLTMGVPASMAWRLGVLRNTCSTRS